MSSSIVGTATYGTPKGELSKIETLRFLIYDFQNEQQREVECFSTPSINAHGLSWNLRIYPRLTNYSGAICVSCCLVCEDASIERVKAVWTLKFGSTCTRHSGPHNDTFQGYEWLSGRRYLQYIPKYLDESGNLKIDVDLQIYVPKKTIWYPSPVGMNPFYGNSMLESSVDADVWFLVGKDRAKFHAHKCVLRQQAPILYELIKDTEDEEIEICNMSEPVFKTFLEYVYVGSLPTLEDASVAKELLLTADRYGTKILKLFVESELVSKFVKSDNAASLLLISLKDTPARS